MYFLLGQGITWNEKKFKKKSLNRSYSSSRSYIKNSMKNVRFLYTTSFVRKISNFNPESQA